MVCEWGMSETIGPLKIGRANEEVFLGKDYNENRNTSDHVSELIDNEISKLIKNAESNATNIINSNIDKLHDLTNALLDLDTIDSEEFVDILKNGYNPENKDLESSETNTDSEKQSRRTSKTVIKES